ncbi:lysophospholipase L1-like esterase [Thermocatellispora tengchongensis]|uniref:Lysophospholipase L1-like esterase n=1 Tax=Thermocatellispora tengchongensis TaxID=1073253 RepID=A0A840PDJ1_9ACTN|nr:SGNH/GDSL hydrolase family protein [Thermocatellispora tengchongensis]MBB5135490.1 lysophospholipase L1-like esterase [Thermocatellispora tengchongensis]
MRVRRLGLSLAPVLAAGLIATPAAASAPPLRYVALGDSSAAGPLIPREIDATCLRSDRNWPHVLAGLLRAALTDVTCSGAKTTDLAGRQFGEVAPQYDALRPDTDLVTLAIGANDILLGSAFVTCANPQPPPTGPTCRERHTVDGVDQYAARIDATAPKVAAALEEIHRRSPRADVVVVGYLTYWRRGGCYPADPFTSADADYLQATFDRLMAMLARQAAAHDAIYVDIRRPSARHGLCEPPARRWLEGAVPASPAYPYHPNAAGMARAAGIIAEAVRDRGSHGPRTPVRR